MDGYLVIVTRKLKKDGKHIPWNHFWKRSKMKIIWSLFVYFAVWLRFDSKTYEKHMEDVNGSFIKHNVNKVTSYVLKQTRNWSEATCLCTWLLLYYFPKCVTAKQRQENKEKFKIQKKKKGYNLSAIVLNSYTPLRCFTCVHCLLLNCSLNVSMCFSVCFSIGHQMSFMCFAVCSPICFSNIFYSSPHSRSTYLFQDCFLLLLLKSISCPSNYGFRY